MGKINWQRYKDDVNNFHYEANQVDIIWRRNTSRINRLGEDNNVDTYSDRILKGLIQFNDFRTWPITKFTLTGEEDKQSEVLILNIAYLQREGLLDNNKNFAYNPSKDRFIHKGIEYEDSGSTSVAQASDEDLFFYIILKRTNG